MFVYVVDDRGGSGVAGIECSLDGAAFSSCMTGGTGTNSNVADSKRDRNLPEGRPPFRLRAVDAAGNPTATPTRFVWTIDTLAPETRITIMPPMYSNNDQT